MKVCLITEGGSEKGLGHISRNIALYQGFLENNITPEFIIAYEGEEPSIMEGIPYQNISWLNDPNTLLERIKGADIVIIDSYRMDKALSRNISALVKVTAFLDDDPSFERSNCILINGSILAQDLYKSRSEDVQYLLGPRYMLLRKSFLNIQPRETHKEVEGVFISLGGKDLRGLLPKIALMLAKQYPGIQRCVLGGGFSEERGKNDDYPEGRTRILNRASADEIRDVMLSCDLAVTAGGQTLNELARVGLPAIVIGIADNQTPNIQGWRKTGFIEYAGQWNDAGLLKNIKEKMDLCLDINRRRTMGEIGRKTVDGAGSERVVGELLNIHENLRLGAGPLSAMN